MSAQTATELTAESMARFLKNGGAVDLSNRSKFRLSGNDRVRYLSGQVTQAVSDVSEAHTLYACVTNHKGKMEGDVFITGSDHLQSFVIDADESLRESLFARLDRYIIADDVELTDITDDWKLIHIIGDHCTDTEISARSANRFGVPGNDYWIPAASDASEWLADIPTIDSRALDVMRITHGIGEWGIELTPEILPPEARLEERAISYTKGCYIGQEVISRIRSVGRVNRTLERIDCITGATLAASMALTDSNGKAVGNITRAAYHPAHHEGPRWIALAFIRRGSSEPGTQLFARANDYGEDPAENMLSSTVEVMNTPDH